MANDSRSGSGSGSGDAGLRKSSRESPSKKLSDNGSPGIVRKSERLGKLTASETSPEKKRLEQPKPSPLRRSGRENKFQSSSSSVSEKGSTSKSGLKQQKDSNSNSNSPASKGKDRDMTPEVGTKRKKLMDARRFKNMYLNPNKKSKVSDSSKEKGHGSRDGGGQKKSDSDKEGGEENSDGEELKEDSTNNVDVGRGGSYCDVKKQVSIEKQYASETVEHFGPPVTADVPMPSSEAKTNEAEECSVREKHDYKENNLTSNELSNGSNGVKCNPNRTTLGASVDGREDGETFPEDVPSISSLCKINYLTVQCTKCFRKRRLEFNSLKRELCCCLLHSTCDADLPSVSKDSGEGETLLTVQRAEKHGQNVRESEPPVDGERDTCLICKSAGILLRCGGKGCTSSFHTACLSTPDENVLLPMWYCCECTKKRLTFGIHAVSEGIESIWDVREVDFSNSTGAEKQKQYFVKYKGLAHCHNHWVAELQLLYEVPELLAKFRKNEDTATQWNPEWVVPHRLLKQRLLVADESDKHNDRVDSILADCQREWLVKWRGLDYDQATWEFQDSSCFTASDLQHLIREYETRHEKAKIPASSGNEIQERKKGSHAKARRIFRGGLFGVESCYIHSVTKLIDKHHKRHNAVLLDEQDRIVKVVYLISSIVADICRPILIISPCISLPFWEAEFLRLAAPINVVVYAGSTGSRNIIRNLEFYEGDCIMLQVLLSSPEVVSEDLNVIKGIEWEAVIVDDCQKSGVMAHIGSIKNVVTNWRLLLLNAQLKDDVTEYVNILSLLESGDNSNQNSGLIVDSSENITVLKERLSLFISCARFLEYWVPVEMSNIQLEKYCSLLLSSLTILLSVSKTDHVGSLRDILISTKKCCDHPFLVEPSLHALVDNLMSHLELGTQASGKLTLLDEVLSEFRNQERKVLILFQSPRGSGRDSMGDIIEDFLSLRFDKSSYERVSGVCLPSKKQAVLDNFNKQKERSFLLLETRSCLPGIKLSSLDAVIIFDSDWNPLNDLRALRKITIDSKLDQIKVFRFYCCCTAEEKVLILAKNDTILDSALNGISRNTSHKLLMWGSSHLFSRLEEFHNDMGDCKDNIVPSYSFLKDVSKEILSVFQNNETKNPNKFISVALQNGGGYLKSTALAGEQKIELEDGMLPHCFWTKLLKGKQPQWKYLSGSSHRNRKRVQYQELEDQDNEATKKNRKMDRTKGDSSSPHTAENMEKSCTGDKEFQDHFGSAMTNKLDSTKNIKPSSHILGALSDEKKNLYTEQRDLFQMLKPSVLRLCETLQVKDDTKRLAEQFLEYVLKNHRVVAEPEAVLQAFQISVCWSAMEALDQKVDHKKSLDVARECMNLICRKEEAEAIYSKTKMLMKIFIRGREGFKISDSSNTTVSTNNGIARGSQEHESSVLDGFDQQTQAFRWTPDSGNDIFRHVKKVKKKCDKLLEGLKVQHREELEKFEKECEHKRAEFEKKYKLESSIILSIHGKSPVGVSKLKIVDRNCAKEKEDLELEISTRRKELEARFQVERDEQQNKTAKWLDQVKSLVPHELSYSFPSENDKLLQASECIVLEENSDACAKHNFVKETSVIPGSDLRPVVSELSKPQENTVISEVPSPVTNEERENGMSEEVSFNDYLPKTQTVSISESVLDRCGQEGPLEQFPCANTREMDKEDSQMESVEVNRSTVLETNQVHEASTTLVTEPLCSSGISLTKQPATDPASETPLSGSQLGYESCQILAGGADELAQHVTDMHNVLPQDETTLLVCSDPMRSNSVFSVGLHSLPSTENSFPEALITPHSHDQTRIAPSNRLDSQPREGHTFAQDTEAAIQLEGHINALGQTISGAMLESVVNPNVNAHLGQFESQTSTRGTILPRGSHPNPQVPIFANSRSSDPLQNELERIQKEIDEVINIHEETQLQLKSNCDKEIEEIVAQIRRQYAEKRGAVEASFKVQRKELEVNKKKVMMHKILAEAFRSKCMDYRAASGMQQGISSGSVEHVSQMQRATATPSSTSGLRSSGNPQNSAPAPRAIHPSAAFGPSPASRAPHIRPLGPTSGHPVSNSLHVPPPQLQPPPFRSASIPVSSSNTPGPSSLIPNPHNASNQGKSTLTPMEITMQNENVRGLVTPPSNLPDSSVQNHITRPNSQMSSSSLGKDVVCLSDDE